MKHLLNILGIMMILIILVIFYIAYIYEPKTGPVLRSSYLRTVRSRYLKTGRYQVHYIHEGSGEPVILIHGGGSWLYSFRQNLPVLAKRFSVYALDMPGHGYTTSLMGRPKYDLETYSEFLLDFMKKQKIEKASLVGNSWGGGWALYFAQRHPERVDKLVLIDSSGTCLHDVFEWEAFKAPVVGEALSKFINRDTVEISLKKVFYNKDKINAAMVNELTIPMSCKENRRAQYLAERNLDWRLTAGKLSGVKNKTLIIWGKNDNYLDYHEAFRFEKGIRNSRLLLLDNCGHVAHEDRPDIVNQAIEGFLLEK